MTWEMTARTTGAHGTGGLRTSDTHPGQGGHLDMDIMEVNTIPFVIANNKGITLTRTTPRHGHSRVFRVGTTLNSRLRLHETDRGDSLIVPSRSMPVSLFLGRLEELAMRCPKAGPQ